MSGSWPSRTPDNLPRSKRVRAWIRGRAPNCPFLRCRAVSSGSRSPDPASSSSAPRSGAASSCSVPPAFVRHGLSLLWVVGIAVTLQTIFNTEVMRYTLATGEPVFTGFMRTRPSSTFWAWVYVVLYFLQVGWPAWAGTAAGAIFLSLHAPARRCSGRESDLPDRRRDVPAVRRHPVGWPADRADAGAAELDPRRGDSRQFSRARRALCAGDPRGQAGQWD